MTGPRIQRGLDAPMSDAELLAEAKRRQARSSNIGNLGTSQEHTYPEPDACEIGGTEKAVERAGDVLMRTYGFEPIRFSQPRASKQTPGIPDRLYLNPERRLAVWWEAKARGGKQRPAQATFQRQVEACGMDYVLGGVDMLRAWLTRKLEAR